MPRKIKIDLGYAVLTAERNSDLTYPEIIVGLEDSSGSWIQDLAIVGSQYHYNDGEVVCDEGISIKVYSDKENEDFTHDFNVGIYREPEDGGVA